MSRVSSRPDNRTFSDCGKVFCVVHEAADVAMEHLKYDLCDWRTDFLIIVNLNLLPCGSIG